MRHGTIDRSPPPRSSSARARVGARSGIVAAVTSLVVPVAMSLPPPSMPATRIPSAAPQLPPKSPSKEATESRRLLGPRVGPERRRALERHGGDARTEEAVARALDWLARHERPEGGFDADGFASRCGSASACDGIGKGQHGEEVPCPFDDAITGLAALAFLGAGHLPSDADLVESDEDVSSSEKGSAAPPIESRDDPHADLVTRALARLETTDTPWGLALATQAFAEAEAMEGRGRFLDRVRRNVETLLAARQEDGAWGYAAPWRPGSDVPYTAFVVQALVAARDAGVEPPADLGARVDAFLGSLEMRKGRLAYLVDGRKYGYTPTTSNAHCAAAIRELLGVAKGSARHRSHMNLLAAERPAWKVETTKVGLPGRGVVDLPVGNLSMYAWWYGSIAAFQAGGGFWKEWFEAAKKALLEHQRTDGCARGSWDPVGTYERQTGGRVMATALGALILEQPYRDRRLE